MPAGPDTEAQFRFLISCIRNSSGGKVDFEAVRLECNVVSKGAAAKRYERLMKAHNIPTNAAANGVKKEAKDSEETKKPKARPAKKRKLEEVNEDEGDIDEPVKAEAKIKGEVKYEDAIVKPEYRNDDPTGATPLHRPSSQYQPAPSSANAQSDDDDEVLFVSATDRRTSPDAPPAYGGDHRQSHTHSPMPIMNGIQPVDYAANMTFPSQFAAPPAPSPPSAMATMATLSPSNSFPYGYTPTAWVFPHDNHSCL
ncbi:hypothetical protein O1611_g841 [Lasiodiplodia mahajangana]|uniref:Uncharacterized protein n=1 Tax=Lasiodiplodia mahajangana TaxID=1108764 RepID=A0ACC2JZE5_9PEZI|nr:hypothetical protein O1611_g841 [Lasiodiplodia mahajangana]